MRGYEGEYESGDLGALMRCAGGYGVEPRVSLPGGACGRGLGWLQDEKTYWSKD
jgi:hypothetical protein